MSVATGGACFWGVPKPALHVGALNIKIVYCVTLLELNYRPPMYGGHCTGLVIRKLLVGVQIQRSDYVKKSISVKPSALFLCK